MIDPVEANRLQWEERTPIHAASGFYDVEGFKAGRSSLHRIEVEELGEVAGKDLLHLQCHFGLDTLSWARRGARVTGADFSPSAIAVAQELARDIGISARFVCSTIDALPDVLESRFDIVFTSYGALMWLPDIEHWATVVAHYLRPGGLVYLAEMHPLLGALAVESPTLQSSYFNGPGPNRWEGDRDYAVHEHTLEHPQYEWTHTVGEVVTALVGAGLRLEFLREHPVLPEQARDYMVRDDSGWWRIPGDPLPLTYSLRARRPAR